VVLAIVSWRLHQKFFQCLRTRHVQLYSDLIGARIWGYRSPRYQLWFWSRGYDSLNDSDVALLGSKITGTLLLVYLCLLLWAACVW
jgi:hypothetical protein